MFEYFPCCISRYRQIQMKNEETKDRDTYDPSYNWNYNDNSYLTNASRWLRNKEQNHIDDKQSSREHYKA